MVIWKCIIKDLIPVSMGDHQQLHRPFPEEKQKMWGQEGEQKGLKQSTFGVVGGNHKPYIKKIKGEYVSVCSIAMWLNWLNFQLVLSQGFLVSLSDLGYLKTLVYTKSTFMWNFHSFRSGKYFKIFQTYDIVLTSYWIFNTQDNVLFTKITHWLSSYCSFN